MGREYPFNAVTAADMIVCFASVHKFREDVLNIWPVKWSSIAVLHCLVVAFLPSLIIRPLPYANNSIMVLTKWALSDNQTWE